MRPLHHTGTLVIAASFLMAARAEGQTTPPAGGAARGPARRAAAQPAPRGTCRVEGVWELVSTSRNGADDVRPGYHQRKVLTRGHFMWVGEDAKRDTLPLRTEADSLRATQFSGGAGTYTVAGNHYTERLEYFSDPSMIGQSVRATCRTTGDRWYHVFTLPTDTTGVPRSQITHLSELWRRVE